MVREWGWGCNENCVSSAGNAMTRSTSGDKWQGKLVEKGQEEHSLEKWGRGWCSEVLGSHEALISSSMKVGVLKATSPSRETPEMGIGNHGQPGETGLGGQRRNR